VVKNEKNVHKHKTEKEKLLEVIDLETHKKVFFLLMEQIDADSCDSKGHERSLNKKEYIRAKGFKPKCNKLHDLEHKYFKKDNYKDLQGVVCDKCDQDIPRKKFEEDGVHSCVKDDCPFVMCNKCYLQAVQSIYENFPNHFHHHQWPKYKGQEMTETSEVSERSIVDNYT